MAFWGGVVLASVHWVGEATAQDQVDAGTIGDQTDSSTEREELRALSDRLRRVEEQLAEQKSMADEDRRSQTSTKAKVKELAEAIQLSGFFDVSISTYRNNPNVFDLGSFEFDLKKEFSRYFQVGAALVFADKQADLAVGFIDLHLFGGLIPARGNIFLESGFHLQVGKFDVPFGNDWIYFATLDRPTMSAPLTTTLLMNGGYNDVGFRVVGNYRFVNYAGYVLEGVGNGVAVGGRLAFIPFNNPFTLKGMDAQPLDLGFSYLRDFSQVGTIEQRTYAVDIEARWEFLRLQAEYYRRHDMLDSMHRTGYQLSLFASFLEDQPLPFGLGARYDELEGDSDDALVHEHLRRVTGSALVRPFDVVVLKLEYYHFLSGNEDLHGDSVYMQLVIGFK